MDTGQPTSPELETLCGAVKLLADSVDRLMNDFTNEFGTVSQDPVASEPKEQTRLEQQITSIREITHTLLEYQRAFRIRVIDKIATPVAAKSSG